MAFMMKDILLLKFIRLSAIGGVRGSLDWDDFCNMQIPVPSIEQQSQIVQEYPNVTERIQLNEKQNQALHRLADLFLERLGALGK
jgi:restriction endonuclease S subunit